MLNINEAEFGALVGRFDADWYLARYLDVAVPGMSPAEHFLWIDDRLGRNGMAIEGRNRSTK